MVLTVPPTVAGGSTSNFHADRDPPATAGGTDLLQVRSLALNGKPFI